ncbi:MAG: N-acetylmannosamine-6-phosphate 2-epimerase [Pyrinomonadaceae bacterium]|nr:N-acetylmannosamine-6-phosphate 2-epimerase [Pyrinomonadaceae bacterium]
MKLEQVLAAWRGGIIVSCQAEAGSPLAHPAIIAALAQTAERNGAVGVRIDGPGNIHAVREVVTVPVLGIEKTTHKDSDVYITPTYEAAARVVASGADVIALDATSRPRPNGETLPKIIERIKMDLKCPVMADVATEREGVWAIEEAGANIVGTTLSGYTAETADRKDEPDFSLIERLASRLSAPVICEGRVRQAEDVRRAFAAGAFAVVVGTAITNVDWLVRHFVAATPNVSKQTSAPGL